MPRAVARAASAQKSAGVSPVRRAANAMKSYASGAKRRSTPSQPRRRQMPPVPPRRAGVRAVGTWRAYGNTNPITSGPSTWMCGRSRDIQFGDYSVVARHGWPGHAVDMSMVFYRYLIDYPSDALQIHTNALEAATQAGDVAGEANALLGVCIAQCEQGRHAAGAAAHLRRAVDISAHVADPICEAEALECMGVLHTRIGQHEHAAAALDRALHLFRGLGHQRGEARVLNALGDIALAEGDPETATARYTAAFEIAADIRSQDQKTRAQSGLRFAVAGVTGH